MRLLIVEFITGGGLRSEPLPASLAAEGDLMLKAVATDFADLADVEVLVTRDDRLEPLPVAAVRCRPVSHGADPWAWWKACMSEVDAVLPIAPETAGALERMSALALSSGCELLGSPPSAIGVAASKLLTMERLASAGVPVVPTRRASEAPPDSGSGWVLKPDDGVGCEGVRFAENHGALDRMLGDCDRSRHVVQPYVYGTAASLSLLCADGNAAVLAYNVQQAVRHGRDFAVDGLLVNGLVHERVVLEPLASRIAGAMPELWGYAGVDLVFAATGPQVLEVNPRITTSYTALRRSLDCNPAALILQLRRDRDAALDAARNLRGVEIEVRWA